MSKGKRYDSMMAARISTRLCSALYPACNRIAVVGSLRRGLAKVGDIDVVCVPTAEETEVVSDDLFQKTVKKTVYPIMDVLNRLQAANIYEVIDRAPKGTPARKFDKSFDHLSLTNIGPPQPKSWDNGIMKFQLSKLSNEGPANPRWLELKVDIYVCSADRFVLSRFIRTGSKEHNIRIAKLCKERGWKLKADGSGVSMPDGTIKTIESEEEIFELLEIKYLDPRNRDEKAAAR